MKSQLFTIDFLKISTLFFWSSWCQEFLSWGAPVYRGRVLAAPWSRVRVRPVTLICRSSPLSLSLSSHFILTLLSFLFSKNMNKAKNLKSKKSIQFLIIWKRKAFLQRSKVKYEFNVYRLHCGQRLTKDPLSCGSHVIHQCVFTCELYTHALLHVCPPCMCLHVAVRN